MSVGWQYAAKEAAKRFFEEIRKIVSIKRILLEMDGKRTNGEIKYQNMAFFKIYKYFDCQPSHNINTGIRKTIEWYFRYFSQMKSYMIEYWMDHSNCECIDDI